jgi:anti-repressor protein
MGESLPQVFQFRSAQVRVVMQGESPWFVAADVCAALGYANASDAISKHCKAAEIFTLAIREGIRGNPNVTIIPESDLYRLIMRSKMDEAEAFQDWVVGEVLPSIRKSGSYALVPKSLPEALRLYADEVEKRELAEKERLLLAEKIKADEPLTNFGRSVSHSAGTTTIGDFAKILNNAGIKIGQNRLFDWLRGNGYLIDGGRSHNSPQQRYLEQGLFALKEAHIQTNHGEKLRTTTLVTGKGQAHILAKMQQEIPANA